MWRYIINNRDFAGKKVPKIKKKKHVPICGVAYNNGCVCMCGAMRERE